VIFKKRREEKNKKELLN